MSDLYAALLLERFGPVVELEREARRKPRPRRRRRPGRPEQGGR